MSEFGYIPDSANIEQSFGNNKGIFTPKDIYDLKKLGKWTLDNSDLILLSEMDFTDVSSLSVGLPTGYNNHVLLFNEFSPIADNTQLNARYIVDGTIQTAGKYSYHTFRNDDSSNVYQLAASSTSAMVLFNATSSQIKYSGGWQMTIQGADNNTVIPKCSWKGVSVDAGGDTTSFDGEGMWSDGGSGTSPTRTRQEAIHFYMSSNNISGKVSVFGVNKS